MIGGNAADFPLTLLEPRVVSANLAALMQSGRGVKILLWACGVLTGFSVLFFVMLKFVLISVGSQFHSVFIWSSSANILILTGRGYAWIR